MRRFVGAALMVAAWAVPKIAAQAGSDAATTQRHVAAQSAGSRAFDAALNQYNKGHLARATGLFYGFLHAGTLPEKNISAPQAAQDLGDAKAPSAARGGHDSDKGGDSDTDRDNAQQPEAALQAAQTASNVAWAHFFLGECLRGLGLHHAATVYYYEVVKQATEPMLVPRALARLKDIVETRPFDTRLVYDSLLDAVDFANLPRGLSDWVAFEQGRRDIQRGFNNWGDRHLADIAPDSAYAAQADYIRAVRLVRDGKDVAALALFDAVAHASAASSDVVHMAQLAQARLRFDQGDYAGALAAYANVKPKHLSFEEGLVLTEKAWTHYYLGHVAEALGALHALGAPSYEDFFYPDMFLLRALIYKDRCHFLSAKDVVRAFRIKFGRTFEQLRARAPQERIERIRRAAVMQGPLARRTKLLLHLVDERDRIDSVLEASDGKLAQHLTTLYETAIDDNDAVWRHGFVKAADAVSLRLLDAQEQINVLDYEVSLAIFKPIDDADAAAAADADVQGVATAALAQSDAGLDAQRAAIYPFDGEFWHDELGDYQVILPNLCLGDSP